MNGPKPRGKDADIDCHGKRNRVGNILIEEDDLDVTAKILCDLQTKILVIDCLYVFHHVTYSEPAVGKLLDLAYYGQAYSRTMFRSAKVWSTCMLQVSQEESPPKSFTIFLYPVSRSVAHPAQ